MSQTWLINHATLARIPRQFETHRNGLWVDIDAYDEGLTSQSWTFVCWHGRQLLARPRDELAARVYAVAGSRKTGQGQCQRWSVTDLRVYSYRVLEYEES